ncbi:hypothetical protein H7X46_21395 [Pseudonocardia sp. C8]|uniref:hypothetical protein n=1 Tax=Pseudonocardia sp. C8 TaxID=2762759 RepID=UPI001643148B|nr:hypothetical protein [Pseudonocardia sp. C8]MBC3193617.1 hypothetical protein [Pseudonocardia sp. C8]
MAFDLVPRLGTIVGMLVALVVICLLLRWTFGHHKNLLLPTEDPDDPVATGLLTEVARRPDADAAATLRERLRSEGIRSTVSPADDGGYALLVFPRDVPGATAVLGRDHPPG